MRLVATTSLSDLTMYRPLASRATDPGNDDSGPSNTALIVCVNSLPVVSTLTERKVIIILVTTGFLLAALYIYLRSLRTRHSNPKYIPTQFLKSRWRSWNPRSMYGRMSAPSHSSRSLHTRDTSNNHSIESTEATIPPSTEVAAAAGNNIDRNTSVRSVITLPAYNATLNPSERLIAREGERAGVDTVIEFPETAEEEEAQREEDMEALYQIRQVRRQEIDEREERRRERQSAREAGDWARLEQLRLQSQLRARARAESAASAASSTSSLTPATGSGALIIEHNARTSSRDRRVSSVSYASLGLARHDGSRLRADSVESNDQRPLLDSAASMGGSHHGSRRNSFLGQPPHVHQHRRAPSAESFMSADSIVQDTPRTSPHDDRSGSDAPPLQLQTHTGGSGGDPPLPPQYDQAGFDDEEAPPYMSPVAGRGEGLGAVPAIEVTGTTPANSVPATPVEGLGTANERRGR